MAIELLDRGASHITVMDHWCRHYSAYGHDLIDAARASRWWGGRDESVGIGHVVIDAIVAGDVEVLRHVLKTRPKESVQRISQHCDFNSAIYRLSWCAAGEKVAEILQLLLSHGAGLDIHAWINLDWEQESPGRPKWVAYTPLQCAACHDNLDVFKALWTAGARLGKLPDRTSDRQGLDIVGRTLACWFHALEGYRDFVPGDDLEEARPEKKGAFLPFLCFLQEQGHVFSEETVHWASVEYMIDLEDLLTIAHCYRLRRSGIPPSVYEMPELEWTLAKWYYSSRPWVRRELEKGIEYLLESGAKVNWQDMHFSLPHFAQLLVMPDMPEAECSEADDDEARDEIQRAKFKEARSRVDLPFSLPSLAQLLSMPGMPEAEAEAKCREANRGLPGDPRHPSYRELWEVTLPLGGYHDTMTIEMIGFDRGQGRFVAGGSWPQPETTLLPYYPIDGIRRVWRSMLARGLQVQEPVPGRMPGHLIKALYARDCHFLKWLVQNMGPGNISTDEAADFIHLLSTANIGVPNSVVNDVLPRLEDLAKSTPWVEKLTWYDWRGNLTWSGPLATYGRISVD